MTEIKAIKMDNYDSRKVAIQVVGLPNQTLKRTSNYTVIVPYYRFSQTIQQICRTGGRIVDITLHSSSLIATKTAEILPETKTGFSQTLASAEISESESIATSEPQRETIAPKDSQAEITPAPVESATTRSQITTSKVVRSPRKTTQARRKKSQIDSAKYLKKTMRNAAKIRGKKERKKSKPYLFN